VSRGDEGRGGTLDPHNVGVRLTPLIIVVSYVGTPCLCAVANVSYTWRRVVGGAEIMKTLNFALFLE